MFLIIKILKNPKSRQKDIKTRFRKALFSESVAFLVAMIVKASTETMVDNREYYLENRSTLKILMPHKTAPNMVEK